LALDLVLLLLLLSLPLVHCGIILREERYLERKFGDEYRRYKTKIPHTDSDSEAVREFNVLQSPARAPLAPRASTVKAENP
jgi:hypothetical protein